MKTSQRNHQPQCEDAARTFSAQVARAHVSVSSAQWHKTNTQKYRRVPYRPCVLCSQRCAKIKIQQWTHTHHTWTVPSAPGGRRLRLEAAHARAGLSCAWSGRWPRSPASSPAAPPAPATFACSSCSRPAKGNSPATRGSGPKERKTAHHEGAGWEGEP